MAKQKAEESPTSFRIEYFAFGGRGEPIKLAASLGGIQFESKMVTFEQHGAQKSAGKRVWSGLPEVTVLTKEGDTVATLAQSNVCLRFIALSLFSAETLSFC